MAAAALGRKVIVLKAGTEGEIEAAYSELVRQKVDALFVDVDPFFTRQRTQLVALATKYAIPATYATRDFTVAGGLMSYETSRSDSARQVGSYAGRILKGAKPADLPILQPTKFELVINLTMAKTLRLTIPPSLLAIADEVIE